FFMTSFSPLEAILSSFNWSENSRAGQAATSAMMTMRVMDFLGVIGRSRPGSHRSRPASLLEIGVR
ncbi:hypothetical protein ACX84G_28685, partial [Burkholderia pseudomallei]